MSSEASPQRSTDHRPPEPTSRSRGARAASTADRFQRFQEVVGRKWHPVIVYQLLHDGPQGFSDLRSTIDGISGKMLSESLEALQSTGLLERRIISEQPFRVEYALTEEGRALEPVLTTMLDWEATHCQRE